MNIPLITIVIPHYPKISSADQALQSLLFSLKNYSLEVLEKLVVVNDGEGFAVACNRGLKEAKGQYLIVSNNDVEILNGNIVDLADPTAITVPNILPEPRDNMPRCFYCVPRSIYEEIVKEYGFWYDERFEMGYFEDDDLIKRLQKEDVTIKKIDNFLLYHIGGGGLTMKQIGEEKYFELNKKKFEEKWNDEDTS